MIFDLEHKLSGVGQMLGLVGQLLFITITGTFAAALLLAFLRRWTKRRWLAAVLLSLLAVLLSGQLLPALLAFTLAIAGVLAAVCAWLAFGLVVYMPATADPSLWWAWPEAWLLSACLVVLATLAFRQATGLARV